MKTTQRYGLLFYSSRDIGGGYRRVFAVEMWNGHIRYIYGTISGADVGQQPSVGVESSGSITGAEGLRVMTDNSPRSLDDDRWHGVSVLRPNAKVHILQVDDAVSHDTVQHRQQHQQPPPPTIQEVCGSSSRVRITNVISTVLLCFEKISAAR
jgi:hypothetical protein